MILKNCETKMIKIVFNHVTNIFFVDEAYFLNVGPLYLHFITVS